MESTTHVQPDIGFRRKQNGKRKLSLWASNDESSAYGSVLKCPWRAPSAELTDSLCVALRIDPMEYRRAVAVKQLFHRVAPLNRRNNNSFYCFVTYKVAKNAKKSISNA